MPSTQKDIIKAHILREYLKHRTAIFWPQETEGLSTKQIKRALDALTKEGLLEGVVLLLSDSGHLCWSASPELYEKLHRPFRCPDLSCDYLHDELPKKLPPTYYVISKTWKALLKGAGYD